MSETYVTLVVARKQMTSELIEKILFDDFSDTSKESVIDLLETRNNGRLERGEPLVPVPDTTYEQYEQYQNYITDGTFHFSGETNADNHTGEEVCQLLRDAGITYSYTMYYDEDNAETTIWSPDELEYNFDICRDGNPTIPLSDMESALSSGTDAEKLERVEELFRKRSSYGRITPQKIVTMDSNEISQIDEILAMLDAGAITKSDAFEQIKLAKGA